MRQKALEPMKLGNRWVGVSFDENVTRLGIGDVLVPFDSLEVLARELVREEETAHRITALTNQTNQLHHLSPPTTLPPQKKTKKQTPTKSAP